MSLATVHALHGPTGVERAREEILRAIRAGRLKPGEPFSLRDIAEEQAVRTSSLRDALRHTERHGPFTLRGDVGVVAALDLRELRSLHELRVQLQVGLAARACELIAPAELDRLEAAVPGRPMGIGEHDDELYDARRDFWLGLCRPAASAWDLRVLLDVWHGSERYHRLGIDAITGPATADSAGSQALMVDIREQHREFIARCRSRDPRAVASAVLRNTHWAKAVGEESFA